MSNILRTQKRTEVTVDREAGAAYIYLTDKRATSDNPVTSIPVNENLVIDIDSDGKLYGIEVLNLKLLDDQE